MFGGIGVQELILIFLVVLLLFGSKRIPDIAHAIGKGIHDFKKAMQETQDAINAPPPEPPRPKERKPTDDTAKDEHAP
ncbi:MAG: twin-arginine translocase TatA/TatE family subunit [Candidatus Zixiibacteriota bacterium]